MACLCLRGSRTTLVQSYRGSRSRKRGLWRALPLQAVLSALLKISRNFLNFFFKENVHWSCTGAKAGSFAQPVPSVQPVRDNRAEHQGRSRWHLDLQLWPMPWLPPVPTPTVRRALQAGPLPAGARTDRTSITARTVRLTAGGSTCLCLSSGYSLAEQTFLSKRA